MDIFSKRLWQQPSGPASMIQAPCYTRSPLQGPRAPSMPYARLCFVLGCNWKLSSSHLSSVFSPLVASSMFPPSRRRAGLLLFPFGRLQRIAVLIDNKGLVVSVLPPPPPPIASYRELHASTISWYQIRTLESPHSPPRHHTIFSLIHALLAFSLPPTAHHQSSFVSRPPFALTL